MNPFRYGQVVSRNNYCQRPSLEKTLRAKLNDGQNVYIEGERRTGKTSLVFETVRKMRGKKVLYIDLMEVKAVEDVFRRVLNAIVTARHSSASLQNFLKGIAALRPTMTFDPISGIPSVSIDRSREYPPDSIEGLFDIFGESGFANTVVVMDEFQDIQNLSEFRQVCAIMRSKIQFIEQTPFVFCGSFRTKMHTIFNDPESPFFKSALPIEVGLIEETAFKKFLRGKFKTAQLEVSSEILETILRITGGNPGDTQQLGAALVDVMNAGDRIDDNALRDGLLQIFAEEQKGYEAHMARITGMQLKCLETVARLGGKNVTSKHFMKHAGISQPSTVRKSLQRLEDLKIVYNCNGEYRFLNPFFAQWLVMKNY